MMMLSRLVRLIETHSQALAACLLDQVQSSEATPNLAEARLPVAAPTRVRRGSFHRAKVSNRGHEEHISAHSPGRRVFRNRTQKGFVDVSLPTRSDNNKIDVIALNQVLDFLPHLALP
jgi:hypothetical protein